MSQLSIMLIAGEPSGDLIAGELITALRAEPRMRAREFAPRFFGAGGPNMAAAGVELDFDMTRHAVVGLWEVLKRIAYFRRLLNRLVELALTRRPNVIVCVDFGGFNLRFARALRTRLRNEGGVFHNWRPRLVQYVSPQVWASRPGRAYSMADTLDLLLCILPYEKSWYARHVPKLRVEFVGHPILERHSSPQAVAAAGGDPIVALLPGSRRGELRAHVPVMLAAARQMLRMTPARFEMVIPNDDLSREACDLCQTAGWPELKPRVSGLGEVLSGAQVAVACTGTVTLECALYGVPTVALYRTSPLTYHIAKRLVTVKYLAMPNLLADALVFPEFIQADATPENLASAALMLMKDPQRRANVKAKLADVVTRLGGPGASRRAATAIMEMLRD